MDSGLFYLPSKNELLVKDIEFISSAREKEKGISNCVDEKNIKTNMENTLTMASPCESDNMCVHIRHVDDNYQADKCFSI